MIDTILEEFTKIATKSIDYEDALFIYILLLEEAKELGEMAEDKHVLVGNARFKSASTTLH